MVATYSITKVVKALEKLLLKKNNFQLKGENYDLILFEPVDEYSNNPKFALWLSAKYLNSDSSRKIVETVLQELRHLLVAHDYATVSSVGIFHTELIEVKNLKFTFSFRNPLIEIKNISIGGTRIDNALLTKSLILDRLIEGRSCVFEMEDGTSRNAGIIRMEDDFRIVHFTGKGLREIHPNFELTPEQKKQSEFLQLQAESFLIVNDYIAKTSLDEIAAIR